MKVHTRWLYRLARLSERGWRRAVPVERPPSVRDAIVGELGAGSVLALNVGARWGDTGAWWRIDPLVRIIGFEPDAAECDRLNALCTDPGRECYLPIALGAEKRAAELHVTRDPGCSSIYAPLAALAERFPELDQIRPEARLSIQLTPLDDWWAGANHPEVSFVKLDTQGSELDILRGAQGLLADCVGLEVEVEFSALYLGQPLFGDVDAFLRERGFVLWRLNDLAHYSERPGMPGETGRLYWGNAVYLRDYRTLGSSTRELRQRLVLAALLESLKDLAAARECVERVRSDRAAMASPEPRRDAAAPEPLAKDRSE